MRDTEEAEILPADESEILDRYWRSNVVIMAVLLLFWALISFGCGILFADSLNQFTLFDTGYPLGFWFAQQGSILGFVIIILVYALIMNHSDIQYHRELESLCRGRRKNETS